MLLYGALSKVGALGPYLSHAPHVQVMRQSPLGACTTPRKITMSNFLISNSRAACVEHRLIISTALMG